MADPNEIDSEIANFTSGFSDNLAATGGLFGSSPRPFRLRLNVLRAFPCNPWRI